METKRSSRLLSLLLVFVLCFSALPILSTEAAAANEMTELSVDRSLTQAELAELPAELTKEEAAFDINAVLNSVELHPQRTGYAALDKLLENILKPYANASTAKKVQVCYDWTVRNINYSWSGYKGEKSGYYGFNRKYPYNDYEEGLQKAFPEEVIARTYYTMSKHEGVCYDWGAVFAVMMRYIGIEAYVHTGIFRFEWDTQWGHHGWAEVKINGTNYIFDPQREFRMCGDGKGTISHTRYYGLRYSDTDRYQQETKVNAKRDAQFLPVTAHRKKFVPINAVASRSGKVTGAGKYDITTTATLRAVPNAGKSFAGWYDASGKLLSSDTAYSFTVSGPATVYAMFADDKFYDIRNNDWYAGAAMRAADLGLISGTRPHRFDGKIAMSRAMVVMILANLEKADLSGYTNTKFSDVKTGQWYTRAVAWANENGIVSGTNKGTFLPDASVTREEFVVIMANYLKWKQFELTDAELPYSDQDAIRAWALSAVKKIQGAGMISGFPDGTFRPQNSLSRAEGVAILVHLVDFMDAAAKA